MDFRRSISVLTLAGLLVLPLLSAMPEVEAQGHGRWQQQAEEDFCLGRGMGKQLMTQEEWQQHRQKMQTMSPEERDRYRQESHKKMVERAHKRGITMPQTPCPRGGQGKGMGPHGGQGQGGRY